jgi:hypothetical protein
VNKPTFGEKLGLRVDRSKLLEKAAGLGLMSAEDLESLAVARGCWHYRHGETAPSSFVSQDLLSDEEVAIALLSPCQPYSPHTIRVGGAMLGSDENDPENVARLAIEEQAVEPVRYIAKCGAGFEPENLYWRKLLGLLPEGSSLPDGVMPHPTRFVSMWGFTREGPGKVTVWIRPQPRLASANG